MTRLQLMYLAATDHHVRAALSPDRDRRSNVTLHPLVDHSPGAMTPRARTYISAGGWRHLLIGLTMLGLPWLYSAAAFIPIFNLLSLNVWGWEMTVVGLVCLVGSLTRRADVARVGMVGSAVTTLVLAAGLSVGVIEVWIAWLNAISPAAVWDLLATRPPTFPVDLLVGTSTVPPSPFLPLVMLAVTVKDFTMCAQPLRVPLEERVGIRGPREA